MCHKPFNKPKERVVNLWVLHVLAFPLFKRFHRKKRDTPEYILVFRSLTVGLWLQPHGQRALSLNLIVVTGFSEMLMNKCAVFKASSFVAFFHHLPLRTHDVSGGAISAAFRFPGIIWWSDAEGREPYIDEIGWLNIAFWVVLNVCLYLRLASRKARSTNKKTGWRGEASASSLDFQTLWQWQ